ncbi:spindle pole protein Nnf1, putative [Metarhizium acridum CQMa 102]|uniref:Spindle pole protein Nnf1, putative n=1 Tax=Metarhizium acridum (strain CQMa 102) TaxID=655827 RepID=E9DRM6_METAQ|nr:spindle pole protein Nnf1, putative [Metarhizium acridum CQMa 102]EFY93904.1 spindle pole protein Nnf1, putative [Metarhizium acridum CQMa 102]
MPETPIPTEDVAAEPEPEKTARPPEEEEEEEEEEVEATKPGPRALRLQEIYAASLARTLDKLSYDNVAPCYPTIARRASPVLRQVQAQMVERLRDKCEKEFGAILRARDVVRKMNDLEGLIADAEERRKLHRETDLPTPYVFFFFLFLLLVSTVNKAFFFALCPLLTRETEYRAHLLSPEEVLRAHLGPRLAEQRGLLNARLQTTQAQNGLLADHVKAQREEIDALLGSLDAAVEDVRSANGVLGGVVGELAGEARGIDAEMGDASVS